MVRSKYSIGDEVSVSLIGKVVSIELRDGKAYYTVRELDGDNKQTFHPFAFVDEDAIFPLPTPEMFERDNDRYETI